MKIAYRKGAMTTKRTFSLSEICSLYLDESVERGSRSQFVERAIMEKLARDLGTAPESQESHGNGPHSDKHKNNDGGYDEKLNVIQEQH